MTNHHRNSPAAYEDVKRVLELALKKPGLRYTLQRYGSAVNFKQRCYRYRNLLREQQAELVSVPGHRAETLFDAIVIRQFDDAGEPSKRGRHLVFELAEPEGVFTDPDTGEPFDPFNTLEEPEA